MLKKIVLFCALLSSPSVLMANSILDFLYIMSVLNVADTRCKEVVSKDNAAKLGQNVVDLLSTLDSLVGKSVLDQRMVMGYIDVISDYCARNPEEHLGSALINMRSEFTNSRTLFSHNQQSVRNENSQKRSKSEASGNRVQQQSQVGRRTIQSDRRRSAPTTNENLQKKSGNDGVKLIY